MSRNLIDKVKKDYCTLGEAALLLSVNPVTIWRWISSGKLAAHRLGREVLIEKCELEKYQRPICANMNSKPAARLLVHSNDF